MNQELTQSFENFTDEKSGKRVNWPAFVESEVVNFFNAHNLERITVEDGRGNKAKLSRQKDSEIKVDYSSTVII
ncbi:MAG: hypothetical protein FWG43_00945 [Clostridiales bacterium]|nr:hypothetical protein [Clostridiales bacterium]